MVGEMNSVIPVDAHTAAGEEPAAGGLRLC